MKLIYLLQLVYMHDNFAFSTSDNVKLLEEIIEIKKIFHTLILNSLYCVNR